MPLIWWQVAGLKTHHLLSSKSPVPSIFKSVSEVQSPMSGRARAGQLGLISVQFQRPGLSPFLPHFHAPFTEGRQETTQWWPMCTQGWTTEPRCSVTRVVLAILHPLGTGARGLTQQLLTSLRVHMRKTRPTVCRCDLTHLLSRCFFTYTLCVGLLGVEAAATSWDQDLLFMELMWCGGEGRESRQLSISPSTYSSIHPFIHTLIIPAYPSTHPSIHPFTQQATFPSIHVSTHLFIHLPTHSSIHHTHPSLHLPIHLFSCSSTHPYIHSLTILPLILPSTIYPSINPSFFYHPPPANFFYM